MEEKSKIEEIESKLADIRYNQGLIMGLTLGILGNLCVSFLIETIHAFGSLLFYTWLAVFIVSLVMTVFVYLLLARRIVMRIVEIFYTVFPSLKPEQKK